MSMIFNRCDLFINHRYLIYHRFSCHVDFPIWGFPSINGFSFVNHPFWGTPIYGIPYILPVKQPNLRPVWTPHRAMVRREHHRSAKETSTCQLHAIKITLRHRIQFPWNSVQHHMTNPVKFPLISHTIPSNPMKKIPQHANHMTSKSKNRIQFEKKHSIHIKIPSSNPVWETLVESQVTADQHHAGPRFQSHQWRHGSKCSACLGTGVEHNSRCCDHVMMMIVIIYI